MLGCDEVDSVAARVHYALRSECPCCNFWRGFLLGAVSIALGIGAIAGSIALVIVALK